MFFMSFFFLLPSQITQKSIGDIDKGRHKKSVSTYPIVVDPTHEHISCYLGIYKARIMILHTH